MAYLFKIVNVYGEKKRIDTLDSSLSLFIHSTIEPDYIKLFPLSITANLRELGEA